MPQEGNYATGWTRSLVAPVRSHLALTPKDKKFSLSSVFSKPSLDLGNTENSTLSLDVSSRFKHHVYPIIYVKVDK